MQYIVYDKKNNKFVTDEEDWILKPNGELKINSFGDEIGMPDCVAFRVLDDSKDSFEYEDEVGGIHSCGMGWHPKTKSWCGECSNASCGQCDWLYK